MQIDDLKKFALETYPFCAFCVLENNVVEYQEYYFQ